MKNLKKQLLPYLIGMFVGIISAVVLLVCFSITIWTVIGAILLGLVSVYCFTVYLGGLMIYAMNQRGIFW